MRLRLLVFGSLALNLFLLVVLVSGLSRSGSPISDKLSGKAGEGDPGGHLAPDNGIRGALSPASDTLRKDSPSAAIDALTGLEALGFPELVSRLRDAGVPEATVVDIVVGRLDREMKREWKASIDPPDLEWWKADVDERLGALVARDIQLFQRERRKRLNGLLGAGWDLDDAGWQGFEPLYGKVLTALPPEKAGKIRAIEGQFAKQMAALAFDGDAAARAVGEVVAARHREEKRKALEAVLNPREYEAYQLRFSELARSMRRDLANFNATSDEFAAIFKIREPVEREIDREHSGLDDGSVRARKDLRRRAADEIRRALGDERYQEYEFNLDPVFRSAREFAAKIGEAEDKAMSLYEIGGWAQLERRRIEGDASLDELSRRSALAETRRRLEQFLQQILSPDARRRSREMGVDFLDSLPR